MQKHLFFALVAACLLPKFSFSQSPWTRSKGGFYVQAGHHFIPKYTKVFGFDGQEVKLDRSIAENTFQFYGEYGISAKTTVVASLPFRLIHSEQGETINPDAILGKISGFSNSTFALRHRVFQKNGLTISGNLRCDLPVKNYNDATGLRAGFDAATILPSVSVGMGYSKFYWFGYGGFGFRTGGYSNLVSAGAEGGFHARKIWLIAFSELNQSTQNGDVNLPFKNGQTYLYVNNQSFLSVGLKVVVEINRFWGIVASGAGVAFAENLPSSPGLGAGVYFKWD